MSASYPTLGFALGENAGLLRDSVRILLVRQPRR